MTDIKWEDANLNWLAHGGMKNKAVKALTQAALICEATAKLKCPVDKGQLRRSITHEVDADAVDAVIGTNVEYAP